MTPKRRQSTHTEHVTAGYIHVCMHAYIHTNIHTYIHTYIHTHIRTYIVHTYVHNVHTYVYTYCIIIHHCVWVCGFGMWPMKVIS